MSPTGAAGRDGRLRVGLRLLEVNQQSLLGLTHGEAVQLLRSVGDTLTVLVCDGFDASAPEVSAPARPVLCHGDWVLPWRGPGDLTLCGLGQPTLSACKPRKRSAVVSQPQG